MSATSPEATGHAGPFFEQHVDAAFLAFLLVRGVPPFMLRAELAEVHLQAAHLEWSTDDVVLVGVDRDGRKRRAAISVKRTFTVAKSDEECVDVFTKAWTDFKSSNFDRETDTLGLITRPGSERVFRALRMLIDTSRLSLDGADFAQRLAMPGYRDKMVRAHAKTIREIIGTAHGCVLSDEDLRGFLCCFDFVCLDLNTPSSATEALLLSLLRASAVAGQSPSVGDETWKELLRLVSHTSPDAGSFRWDALPAELRSLYSVSNAYVAGLLDPFEQMTNVVRDNAETAIAGHHEARTELVQRALGLLETNRVLLIGGLAGGGKTAIAKALFDASGAGRFATAMRAETLARPSIGEALVSIGTSLKKLQEATALHASKLLWIDGAERLLEKSERQAFNDLMRLVTADESWRVVITCRSYSLDTFKAAFLDHHGIQSELMFVPAFTAAELDAFKRACPALTRPLSSEPLRGLLANPFFLRMAARMRWSAEEALPATERDFRLAVWKQAVRKDDDVVDGMPLRRESTFVKVARKRAESLDAFIDVEDLDSGAVMKLKADTLLFESDEALGYFAPSHDVLEDWALLQWLDREYERAHRNWAPFIAALGTCPAIRRAFRAWLTERIGTDTAMLPKIAELVTDAGVQRHWTDDALVAVLRCDDPAPFLQANEQLLLRDGAQLLQRAIHLARVACQQSVTIDTTRGALRVQRPAGAVWQRLAEFVALHVEQLVPRCRALLLRFLEDWCELVSNDNPYPSGSNAIAAIARRLVAEVDIHAYSPDPVTKRALTVMLRVPRESADNIRDLAQQCLARRFHDHDPFVELVLSHFEGAAVCRDVRDVTLAIVEQVLRAPNPPDRTTRSYSPRETLAEAFGLDARLDHFGHPASALHGPFANLLAAHPRDGLQLIVETLNRVSAAHLAARGESFEFSFAVRDGRTVQHRGDGALWGMYRVNSGPEIIRSMLMALERWLLDLGKIDAKLLRHVLLQLMETAETIAITAVVVSVAMAYREELVDLTLEFLKHPLLLQLDRSRWTSDQTNSDKAFANAFPAFSMENAIYSDERVKSAELPHRRLHLEAVAVLLQHGPHRARVHALIDEQLAKLPGEAERSDEDRLWRLALHRMDARNVEIAKAEDGSAVLRIAPPPADVQALVEREAPVHAAIEEGIGLHNWANARYEGRDESSYPSSQWRSRLEDARTKRPVSYADARLIMAVVCLRDYAPDLAADERGWCIDTICAAFDKRAAADDDFGMGIGSGTREAARELAGLLARVNSSKEKRRLEDALARALLVDEHEISRHASVGIGRALHSHDPTLLKCFATALDEYTRKEFSSSASFMRMALSDSRQEEAARAREKLREKMIKAVAKRSVDLGPILANDYLKSPSRFIIFQLAEMFCLCSTDPEAKALFVKFGEQLRATWDADRRGRRLPNGERQGFGYETEVFVSDAIAFFALGLNEEEAVEFFAPFRDTARSHPKAVAKLLHQLSIKEDDRHRPDVFWALWSALSDGLIEWVNGTLQVERSVMDDVASAIFLGLPWKETTTTWRSMAGRDHLLVDAFARVQPCDEIIAHFATHLTTIGRGLLPAAMPVLARKLTEPCVHLTERAISRLEKALANVIYSGAPNVRQDQNLRDATLRVLGVMIEAGSSTAYRMRDDFLTPLRTRRDENIPAPRSAATHP